METEAVLAQEGLAGNHLSSFNVICSKLSQSKPVVVVEFERKFHESLTAHF